MSKSAAWMPFHIGPYLADTGHLTTIEHGAYILLLLAHWSGGDLPDDDSRLARIAKLRIDHWRKVAPTIRAFFGPGDKPGTLRQKRLHAERLKAARLSEVRAEAARGSGRNTRTTPPGVASNDLPANSLNTQGAPAAIAPVLQPVCSGPKQEQEEPSPSGEGAGTAPEASQAIGHPKPVLDFQDEAERVRRQLWHEGRAILVRIAPAMDGKRVGMLIGQMAKKHGGGIRGGTRAIQSLRDLEMRIGSGEVAGYGAAPDALARAAVVERYARGMMTAACGTVAHPDTGADPVVGSAEWRKRRNEARVAEALAQQDDEPGAVPAAAGPTIDGIAEAI